MFEKQMKEAFKGVQGKQVFEKMAQNAIDREIKEEMEWIDSWGNEKLTKPQSKFMFYRGYYAALMHNGIISGDEYLQMMETFKKELFA